MHKKVNVVDITSHAPRPVLTGISGKDFDAWFSKNHDAIHHWAVMSDTRTLKEVVVMRSPGRRFRQ